MKKIWFLLSLLFCALILIWCKQEESFTPIDDSIIPEDSIMQPSATPKWRQQLCEDLTKNELISDNYSFYLEEKESSNPYELVGYVDLARGRAPLRCIIPSEGNQAFLVVENTDLSPLDEEKKMIELNYGAPTSTMTKKDIEAWRKAILSYPYSSNRITQTHISAFWLRTPIFNKITYAWEKQTEKDKEWCQLFPGQFEPFDECLEYLTEWVLIDENWAEKAFTNFKIMVGRYDEQTLMIMWAGF